MYIYRTSSNLGRRTEGIYARKKLSTQIEIYFLSLGVVIIFAPIQDPGRLKKYLDVATMTSIGVDAFLAKIEKENEINKNPGFIAVFRSYGRSEYIDLKLV